MADRRIEKYSKNQLRKIKKRYIRNFAFGFLFGGFIGMFKANLETFLLAGLTCGILMIISFTCSMMNAPKKVRVTIPAILYGFGAMVFIFILDGFNTEKMNIVLWIMCFIAGCVIFLKGGPGMELPKGVTNIWDKNHNIRPDDGFFNY